MSGKRWLEPVKLPSAQAIRKIMEEKYQIKEHEAIHKAQASRVVPSTEKTILLNISPTVVNISVRQVDLYFPVPGVLPENISVKYDGVDKERIWVSCRDATKLSGAVVKFQPYMVDFTKGELLNFSLDISRGGVTMENGMLKIALKRDLECRKKVSLDIPVRKA